MPDTGRRGRAKPEVGISHQDSTDWKVKLTGVASRVFFEIRFASFVS